ncbi:MAG: putative UDP-N-acetylmuramoylalanine--D-glutamate ligase [Candidatus Saccharibacteria bacterium]|nr:putative UDP-N-acetylmuramoylalanine--D-glutamate ligase [Candidatus Saccharibacteria bacterium]
MKIAIAGYGVEGQSSYKYWKRMPMVDITIVDEVEIAPELLPEGAKTIFGPGAFEKLDGFELVMRSAGIPPWKIKTDGKIWSATNEFFLQCTKEREGVAVKIPIIGVTGSKGKGTTASLITSILRAAGRTVHLVGNIGQPALDVLEYIQPSDIVVYELSSFQLWDVERSPETAVVLFIEQEHLDVHKDMEEYVGAKANIAKFQSADDIVIYNQENEYARSIAELSSGIKIGFPSELTAHIKDRDFYNGEQKICSVDALQIPGVHNQSNALAAIDAAWKFTKDPEVIETGLRTFRGLPHRLAFVRNFRGVDYYDDSIATTPTSAIAALRAFDTPKVIILGGSSKGSDFSELAKELTQHEVHALLIGDEAVHIAEVLRAAGFTNFEIIEAPTMEKVVARAHELAKEGSVVLLSPATASFGLFKNYADRGDQFITAVTSL